MEVFTHREIEINTHFDFWGDSEITLQTGDIVSLWTIDDHANKVNQYGKARVNKSWYHQQDLYEAIRIE